MRNVLLVSLMLAATACGGDDGAGNGTRADARRPIDAPRDIDAPPGTPCAGGKTIFLNRDGGTYTGGNDDARANTSVAVDGTQTLAAWPYGEQSWQSLKACVAAGLVPFGVTVTDVDPGTAPHHEIVFTTLFWSGSTVPAVSGASCQATPANGVAFVFGSAGGPLDDPQTWCDLALAQLGTELAGLDQARDCHDYLGTSQTACGAKSYVNSDVKCGDNADRPCFCGGATQNSYQKMRAALCQ